jgi:NADH-quinone oxidoreductase subunit N
MRRNGHGRPIESVISLLGLFVVGAGLSAGLLPTGTAFGGAYTADALTTVYKLVFVGAGLFTVLLSWPEPGANGSVTVLHGGEYLGLMLLSVAGMCLLVSAQDLVLLYVSMELATLPLILLVALNRDEFRGVEAAMKYVFFSALASGLLLFGLSLVYGLTGSTLLPVCAARLQPGSLATLALALVLAGVGFKISAVPFHLWAPDVYEGAPTPVTAFLSVASKAAGFVLFYRLVSGLFEQTSVAMEQIVAVIAVLTMSFGNLTAMHQTNLKRFLAYSSIAQAGYLMIGLVNLGALGRTAVVYYLLVYLVSNMAAFGVVIVIAASSGKEDMRDYVGLSRSNPWLAMVMMLAMFSLAGIPPLAGFLGKFYLFTAAAEKGLYWLVLAGSVNATVSLYYYLLVIRWMYIAEPAPGGNPLGTLHIAWFYRLVLGINAMAMVGLGIMPQVIDWIERAAL